MRYYISDLHYFHEDIIRCDNRGFSGLDEMHEYMIAQWNGKVTAKDEVIILGDFSFGCAADTAAVLRRLNNSRRILVTSVVS